MLIRFMTIMLLLIMSAMPASANESTAEPEVTPAVKLLMDAGVELYEEEVLDNIRIELKDRLEGDTYYIDCTFVNPTNTRLDKKLARTTVTYDLCHADDPYQSITQSTDAVTSIVVEPFASSTTTIALKQPMPVVFNHLTSCTFLFEDNSSLQYNTLGETAPPSPFHLTPVVSPFGEVSLNIQNYSPSDTITELRDIRLNFTIGEDSRKMFITEPIALQIKPKGSYTIPLYTLSSDDSTKAASPFSLSAKTINTTRSYNYHINMKINGIPHTYIDNYADATQISGSLKSTRIDVSDTIYTPILRNVDLNNAAFYVDGTHLYGHITIKTTSGAAIASAQAAYRFVLPYFDQNSQYQEKQITIRLPQDFSIPAHKSAHYAFKVQLPADFSTLHAPQGIPLRPIALPGLTTILLGQVNNASEISKKDYTILSDITIEK